MRIRASFWAEAVGRARQPGINAPCYAVALTVRRLFVLVPLALTCSVAAADEGPYACKGTLPTQAESDAAALTEWRDRALRARVGHNVAYYKDIRRKFVEQRNICDVGGYLTEQIVATTFLGHPLKVHSGAAEALREAEAKVTPRPKVRRIGSLQVRTIRGPFGSAPWLSNHALGRAIDIDPARNLYLSPEELSLLEEISGVELLLSTRHGAGDRWDRLHEAQRAYKKKFAAWRRTETRRVRSLKRAAREGDSGAVAQLEATRRKLRLVRGRKLEAVRRKGILNLPRHLVVALEDAGMIWCTDFVSGADLMHFEYREGR